MDKIRVLTWNYHGISSNYKEEALNEILLENDIDILCLQESYNQVLIQILPSVFTEVIYNNNDSNGVRIFFKTKILQHSQVIKMYRNKLVMTTFTYLNLNIEFNFFAVHLYSKVGRSSRNQMWNNKLIIDSINDFEMQSACGHKSIMLGDFNNNPYEINLLDPYVLNSRESKSLIESHNQIIPNKKFWYNPMWNFLGDWQENKSSSFSNEKIGGSYFSTHYDDQPYWHLFDGVLIRQEFMYNLLLDESKIIHHTKHKNFIRKQIFRKSDSLIHEDFSDHLPFMFTLKF